MNHKKKTKESGSYFYHRGHRGKAGTLFKTHLSVNLSVLCGDSLGAGFLWFLLLQVAGNLHSFNDSFHDRAPTAATQAGRFTPTPRTPPAGNVSAYRRNRTTTTRRTRRVLCCARRVVVVPFFGQREKVFCCFPATQAASFYDTISLVNQYLQNQYLQNHIKCPSTPPPSPPTAPYSPGGDARLVGARCLKSHCHWSSRRFRGP